MNIENTEEYLASLVSAGRVAQKEFETYSQEKVDRAVKAIGKAVYDNAELLARMAVDETRMGDYQSKVAKCRKKSKKCVVASARQEEPGHH